MDTTEQYIKMCEKAEEIQEQKLPNIFDDGRFPFFNNGDYKYVRYGASFNDEGFSMGGKVVWLPRQDQLQEMVKYYHNMPPTKYSARGLLETFWHFVDENWMGYLWTISDEQVSMEQLWLAFVMKEKYNKAWTGDSWEATTI